MKTYEPTLGTTVNEAAQEMVKMAAEGVDTVECQFNDVRLIARPGDTAEGIVAFFYQRAKEIQEQQEKKHAEWLLTPEGQEWSHKQEEAARKADEAKKAGVVPIETADPAGWAKWVETNSKDEYSSCVVRYASRWAAAMEREIASGKKLQDVAKATSHTEDVEGITGFMYGCAVQALATLWKHGEELRRWHNREFQIGTEGDRANETGGVLNPALVTLGGSP